MNTNVVCPAFYKHFKGGLYITESIAINEKDGVSSVVYKNLESGQVWIRPEEEFLAEVPKEKENPTGQKYRFELFIPNKPLRSFSVQEIMKELLDRVECPVSVLKAETDKVLFEEYTVMIDLGGMFDIASGFYSDINEAYKKRLTIPTHRAVIARVTYTKVPEENLTL